MGLKKEKAAMMLAAKKAGEVLLRYHGKKVSIHEKSNNSLVSKADLEANNVIIKIIKKNFPAHSILSEESGLEDNKSQYKWVIDPLDGTHNFLHGLPIFGTSIALEYNSKVVLGVLHFPALKLTAFAEKGKGAFMNGKRIFVSGRRNLNYSFLLTDFNYSERKNWVKIFSSLSSTNIDVRNLGSAVYQLMLVASGHAEAYAVIFTNEWDVAAGILLVGEAGGRVTDLSGGRWDFEKRNYLLSNCLLHEKILRLAKGISK